MTKKTSSKVSMMASLFPQYDQEEEARRLKESRQRGGKRELTGGGSSPKTASKVVKKILKNAEAPSHERTQKKSAAKGSSDSVRKAVERQDQQKRNLRGSNTQEKSRLSCGKKKGVILEDQSSNLFATQELLSEAGVALDLDTLWNEDSLSHTNRPQTVETSEDVQPESGLGLEAFEGIPEDALPPPRPASHLTLRPSVQLHAKLIAQAKDEGIDVESLALEMLSEGVVLRAWEIIERKGAMRGQYGQGSGGYSHQHPRNHWNGRGHDQSSSRYSQPSQEPNYNSFHYQGSPAFSPPQQNYNASSYSGQRGYRPRHPMAWTEDQSAFLEYVRNQEKRGRR